MNQTGMVSCRAVGGSQVTSWPADREKPTPVAARPGRVMTPCFRADRAQFRHLLQPSFRFGSSSPWAKKEKKKCLLSLHSVRTPVHECVSIFDWFPGVSVNHVQFYDYFDRAAASVAAAASLLLLLLPLPLLQHHQQQQQQQERQFTITFRISVALFLT